MTVLRQSLVLGLLALPAYAAAQTSSGMSLSSQTLMSASRVPSLGATDTRSQIPLYEFVDLYTTNLGARGLQLEISGVLGVQTADRPLADPRTERDRTFGNLIVGLARWSDSKNRVQLTGGRQYLFIGAGRAEHLDGLTVSYRLPWNVDLTAFGGRTRPWELDYQQLSGGEATPDSQSYSASNYAAGGQLRFRLLDRGVGSVGFLHEGHGEQTVRQNVMLQLGWWANSALEALGGGILDLVQRKPQELWLGLTSRAIRRVKLTADYQYQVPSLALPKTSIFSVFSLASYHSLGASAYVGLTSWLLGGIEGGPRFYDNADGTAAAYSAAVSLRASLDALAASAIGLRCEFVDSGDERSLQNRLFATHRFAFGLYGNAELFLLWLATDRGAEGSDYERRLDRKPLSLGALGVLGYALSRTLSAQLASSAFVTPLARHDVRLLARLTFQDDWSWKR